MNQDTRLILTGSSDWNKIADKSKTATKTGENSYIPIARFSLGVLSFSSYFAIAININEGKKTWRWAGTVGRVFPFPPNADTAPTGKFISDERPIFINRMQFFAYPKRFSQSFDFVYDPPKWFRDVRIRIWEFIGQTQNPTEEQLDRIESNTEP